MMKHMSLAVAILVVGFLALAHAAAPFQSTYQFRGLGAYGYAYSYDGCSTTGLYVSANQNTSHSDAYGRPVTSDFGFVNWYSFNWCSFSWSGGYAYGDLSVRGNANSLTVSGQLSGWDYNSGAVTVDVDVTFDATGNYVSRGENTSSFSTPWGSGHMRYVGTYADAAISGSIMLGNSNLLASSSFNYGSLYTTNGGSVWLSHQ